MLLAVYGTLRKNRGNHRFLQADGVTFLGEHLTEPKFTMLACGGFPAVIPSGETVIKTEIYDINNNNVINRIYALENYSGNRGSVNNWYDTVDILTKWGKAEMFIWHENKRNLPVIKSGDFLNQ